MNHAEVDSIANRLAEFALEFDERFQRFLQCSTGVPELIEAVRYSALAPGKRIRPFLTVTCAELVGGRREDAWAPAAAIECIHAFSLIHDDLPAMDNDDLRRGRPTCHKRFGEASAILAGDALAVLAFELIAREVADPARAIAMVRELATATGWCGMIGGQAADLQGQSRPPQEATARAIQDQKTAALFSAACRIGAIAGAASREAADKLACFGRHLGRAFQIADDLLDISGAAGRVGKRTGKDAGAGKQTLPRCLGVEESRAVAQREVEKAIGDLTLFGSAAGTLEAVVRYVIARNY
jgi:geranylgeranyl diphosphate synthase type II